MASENYIVDTGAKYTCCSYAVIDDALTEDELAGSTFKLIGGLDRGSMVKFYQYHLRQFTIGNIDLGAQDIWITFDDRITDIILGMDLLKKVMFVFNPNDQKAYFCKGFDEFCRSFGY